MAERENVDPNVVYGYCGCGNTIYKKAPYCWTCDTLLNQGKIKEFMKRLKDHVSYLTGEIYSKQTVEDFV